MTRRAFRIVKTRHVAGAMSGEGARRFGGRWNSPGTTVVYAAATRSLAMLELLVHLHTRQLMSRYAMIPLAFEETLVEVVKPEALPNDWRESPPSPAVQQVGDQWVSAGRSAVLAVPSVVVPEEINYLINPAHRDVRRIQIGDAEPLRLDPRLAGRG